MKTIQKKPIIKMGSKTREAVCAFPTNCIESIHFFLVSDNCCEHISYIKLLGADKPETEVTEMVIDNDNGKFVKMKIVLNGHILILNKATCNTLF